MNYETVTEIGLLAGLGFSFLAVLLFFALEIPALLREMRGLKGNKAAGEPAGGRSNAGGDFPEAAGTMLLGASEAGGPREADDRAAGERELARFGFWKWEIAVRSRREK